ncbi:MAG: hypothetical protein ABL982_05080 [Vicinamibacterales bacterium]
MAHSEHTTPLNQTMHRSDTSVWDKRGWNGSKERITMTRLLIGVGGGALAVQGWRLGSRQGRLLSGVGGSLAWWALTGDHDLSGPRRWLGELAERSPWQRGDRVAEESAESFPASDSPSWTPTVGTGLRRRSSR